MPSSLGSLLRDIQAAFPREQVSTETTSLYARELADVPLAVLEGAVREVIRTGRYFPTVAAIREAAAERMLSLPGEGEALAQVEARIAWGKSREGDPPLVHHLVREAIDGVGGFAAYRTADKPGILRAQFLALFRDLRARKIRAATVGAA